VTVGCHLATQLTEPLSACLTSQNLGYVRSWHGMLAEQMAFLQAAQPLGR